MLLFLCVRGFVGNFFLNGPSIQEDTPAWSIVSDSSLIHFSDCLDMNVFLLKTIEKIFSNLLQTKTIAGLFTTEWIFLTVSLVNILAAVGLTTYR